MPDIADWLEQMMAMNERKASQVAAYAKVSKSSVHNWLKRKARPSYENTVKLAHYFNTPERTALTIAGYVKEGEVIAAERRRMQSIEEIEQRIVQEVYEDPYMPEDLRPFVADTIRRAHRTFLERLQRPSE